MAVTMEDMAALVLRSDEAGSVERAGGKAAALSALAGAFDVPGFFVLTAEAFVDAGLLPEAQEALADELKRLGEGPFAVRSSGREEDGGSSAHAGQFETELNVAANDVAAAAHRVWKSGFSESLAQYRRNHGLSDAPQPPSVIVQRMIAPRAAGVAFTADPVSGERGVVVISAISGLADKLVGGEADGDSYRIGAGGETLEDNRIGEAAVLSEADRRAVATLARRSETHFGRPQDIEWAIDGAGKLWLLQSRPITTLGEPDGVGGDLTIWDNSNIVESYPGVTCALTYSFARYVYSEVYQAFSKLMGVSPATVTAHRHVFDNMLGQIDGRIYYDLLNWYRALALFPGFKANRAYMETMMGVSEALPDDLAEKIAPKTTNGFARLVDQANLVRVGLGLIWHDRKLRRTTEAFYARLNAALATPDAALKAMTPEDLAVEYRELEDRLLAKWDAPLINDFLCMIAFGAARKALSAWGGEAGEAYLSELLIGQGDIVSAEPAQMIKVMGHLAAVCPAAVSRLSLGDIRGVNDAPGLREAFDAYIAKFGDRCTQELKLESRTLHEAPEPVLKAIAAAARTTGAPSDQRHAHAGALDAIIAHPVKRALSRRLAAWAKSRVRDRENLRFERTRLFGRVRRIFVGLGEHYARAGWLDEPRDVFDLEVDEVLGAAEGRRDPGDLRALAAERKAQREAALKRTDPPERIRMVDGQRIDATVSVESGGDVRKGIACCRGVVTARVRVVEDPRLEALEPGEILVARHTDPGWIAVFANASGVIAERGSLLSHSAIVAREMGVPCVVALKGATTWLKTGDLVRLDGGTGVVEKLTGADLP